MTFHSFRQPGLLDEKQPGQWLAGRRTLSGLIPPSPQAHILAVSTISWYIQKKGRITAALLYPAYLSRQEEEWI
jgi:hypothetical protein